MDKNTILAQKQEDAARLNSTDMVLLRTASLENREVNNPKNIYDFLVKYLPAEIIDIYTNEDTQKPIVYLSTVIEVINLVCGSPFYPGFEEKLIRLINRHELNILEKDFDDYLEKFNQVFESIA